MAAKVSFKTLMITPRGFIDHMLGFRFSQPIPVCPPAGFVIVETPAFAFRVKIDIEMGFRDVNPSYNWCGDWCIMFHLDHCPVLVMRGLPHESNPLYPFRPLEKKWAIKL